MKQLTTWVFLLLRTVLQSSALGLGSPRGVVCFLVLSEGVFRELGVHFWGQHVKGVLKLGALIRLPLQALISLVYTG